MKKYLCKTAEVVTDPKGIKNPYCRLSFVDPNGSTDDPFAALERPITIVISGGFFTADNQPDKNRNYNWCKENAPKFQGAETDLHEFVVPVEPYYMLGADGKPKGKVLNTIGVTTFAKVGEDGKVIPRFVSEAGLQRNAANRLQNGTQMYVTVAALEGEKQVNEQLAQATGALINGDPFDASGLTEDTNPYA